MTASQQNFENANRDYYESVQKPAFANMTILPDLEPESSSDDEEKSNEALTK